MQNSLNQHPDISNEVHNSSSSNPIHTHTHTQDPINNSKICGNI